MFANFDSSIAQSNAESPPPKIQIFLFLKSFLFLTEYKTVLFSNFSIPLIENFRGSNEPTPPAIIIFGDKKNFFLLVSIFHPFFSLDKD